MKKRMIFGFIVQSAKKDMKRGACVAIIGRQRVVKFILYAPNGKQLAFWIDVLQGDIIRPAAHALTWLCQHPQGDAHYLVSRVLFLGPFKSVTLNS
jgi:hypothetical protein